MPPPRLRAPNSSFLPFLYPSLRPSATIALTLTFTQPQSRPASHATQGRANKGAQGPGRRLGLKRAATELVVPGTIIFRQKGTRWFPGENVAMGRDHTIYAKEKGYVVYYKDRWRGMGYGGAGRVRDPENKGSGGLHWKKFIGVTLTKGEVLPRPEGRERSRRLGMVVKQRKDFGVEGQEVQQQDISGLTEVKEGTGILAAVPVEERAKQPVKWTKGYQIRESNNSIGRVVDKAGLRVRKFRRGDRWVAWRKRNKRVQAAKALKAQKKARKGKGAARAARSGDLRGA